MDTHERIEAAASRLNPFEIYRARSAARVYNDARAGRLRLPDTPPGGQRFQDENDLRKNARVLATATATVREGARGVVVGREKVNGFLRFHVRWEGMKPGAFTIVRAGDIRRDPAVPVFRVT